MISSVIKKIKMNFLLARTYKWFSYYFNYRNSLIKKLHGSDKVEVTKNSKKIFIPMIETNHYQYLQIMILGLAFKLRGFEVKMLVCDECLEGCELKNILNENDSDPCWTCRFNRKKIVPKFGLKIITYNDLIDKIEMDKLDRLANEFSKSEYKTINYLGIDLKQCVEDSVLRYFYGAVPSNNKEEQKVRHNHIKTALINTYCANKLKKEWNPDIVLTNMAAYSIWYPFYKVFNDKFFTISMRIINFYGVTINLYDIFLSRKRFNKYLSSRKHLKLTSEEKIKLSNFIKNRMTGQDELFIRDKIFDQNQNISELKDGFSINKNKKNIFLFSNLYWDVGLSEQGGLFNNVVDWVLETVKIAEEEKDFNLYVKTHPAEKFGSSKSRKGIGDIIKKEFPDGLTNTFVIEPDKKITPYALFPFIDAAILFSGTLGFELLYSGIPVISVGSAAYNGLDIALEPKTIDEYIYFIKNRNGSSIDKDKVELLTYFFFIKSIIPWDLTKSVYGAKIEDLFNIDSIEELKEGNNIYLDHLCNSMINPELTSPEMWPDK